MTLDVDPATFPTLVVGGGGVSGIAWALGVLVGLDDACPRPDHWARVVGTSAGSTVGAQLLAGRSRPAFEAQFEPSDERFVDVDLADYQRRIAQLLDGASSAAEARARIGRFAIESRTITPERRRTVIAARLAGATWPSNDRLLITAVDAETGELVELTERSGVDLIDAVAASCAVPGVWPVVELHGRLLMDGGMRSTCNADLAGPASACLVVAPSAMDDRAQRRLQRELVPGRSLVLTLDPDSVEAIGPNPFDPDRRAAAAEAGRRQGIAERDRVAAHLAAHLPARDPGPPT